MYANVFNFLINIYMFNDYHAAHTKSKKKKKLKKLDINVTLATQVKCRKCRPTPAHVHNEMKYEVWCVSLI